MPGPAAHERQALSDSFERIGPDAPTLCAGWSTRDLLVHLIVRESRPDAAAALILPPLAGHARSVSAKIAARPWDALVETFRNGPPRLSPFALPGVDERANVGELFVHHEDVLRAQDPTARRTLSPDLQRALWKGLPVLGRLTLRSVPVGVRARCEGYGERTLRSARSGGGTVALVGRPGEVVLQISGRAGNDGDRVDVDVQGEAAAVTAFRTASTGM
ncbi:TIGR03085 family metal-binding protein [Luteipulveratus sp. YIM 133132]|uniref:TIGR03085 family metal-binding protein n=1 Tax=Luteipulveratus flavus TaxID=3031728 RepID=A0ABT6C5G3_9MICO|nr:MULTISPECIES: TIGR03085 family metal-binding protein [unclassified Luteipulveratus]MDE9366023.1 TIGR03085 family metal-binding protein [Luteipulveratus sp. YIM 133132]MDF8264125.1 TIGR03085 family metal-binding protein [Luteipulveratus sp. YIM 133296]